MEQQRIGHSTPPTPAAGVDPAYIPGLMPARPAGTEPDRITDAVPPEDAPPAAPDPEPAAEDSAAPAEAESVPEPEAESDSGSGQPAPDAEPVFEVSDRRGSIAAGPAGIVFRLDTEEAEFGWDEIKAVEIDTPRFTRRFSVTVYTSDRRWFQNDVEAASKTELASWSEQLDAVLDDCFDDSAA
ncbi:hypothetical protein [Streptomyces sp. CAU 1734]|uniref:hypothetical protein n=1 Tax=Streptomyces sp. CAU 1734 TaxID=3140360 RepID=UPI0032618B6B